MSLRIRVIGIAALAALAASAVLASAASAAYNSESSTTFLLGNQTTTNVFTTNGGTVKCKKAEFTGETSGTSLPKLTVHPSYAECTAFGLAAEVTTTGCNYEFQETTATEGTGWHAGVKVICGANPIKINVPSGPCSVTVGSQTVGGVAHFMNVGSGSTRGVEVDSAVTGVTYTSTGGACGSSGENGTYTGKVLENGYKNAGHTEQTGVFIS